MWLRNTNNCVGIQNYVLVVVIKLTHFIYNILMQLWSTPTNIINNSLSVLGRKHSEYANESVVWIITNNNLLHLYECFHTSYTSLSFNPHLMDTSLMYTELYSYVSFDTSVENNLNQVSSVQWFLFYVLDNIWQGSVTNNSNYSIELAWILDNSR